MILPAMKKTYKEQVALDLPSMEIDEGRVLAVCGTNGSGKSTFAKLLAGIVLPDNRIRPVSGRKVGYMNQQSFAFRLSVRNNLLQNSDKKRSREENEARAKELLKAVGLEADISKKANRLSGGQQQRMALARILMKSYDLLILDEPTASMDREAVPLAEELIRSYQKEQGGILILITHSMDQAERLADSFLFLDKGKIRECRGVTLLG